MQRQLTFLRRSEDEEIKQAGITLDFDEIARRGVMSKEEKNVAKWYGIYGSRQPGNHMARVVVPGGVITSSQARNIAKVAEDFAQGRLNITTRQSIQFHWLKVGNVANVMRDLAKEGTSTKHGCGDVTRNTAACPLATTCEYRRMNVLPYAQKTAKFLTDADDLENLPRKFKVTFSGCAGGCAQPYMNCVGNIAVARESGGKREAGFKVVIGGGMGWKAFVGKELFSFVPADRIHLLNRAVALLFRDHGDRFNRAKARLKFVVHRFGIDKCRELILDFLEKEGVSTDGFSTETFEDVGPVIPDRPLTVENPVGTDGKVTVRAMVPKGELSHLQLRSLAELSDVFGNQKLITTNRQNVELPGIEPKNRDEVIRKVEEAGFSTSGFHGIKDIVPCVGSTYCPKAVSTTRDLNDLLTGIVGKAKYASIEKKVMINITGCPNSCSPYRIVDIGFRGMRIREEMGSVEGYEMLIGGHEQNHGLKLGDFKRDDCPEITEKVLDHFVDVRTGEETLTDTVRRVGIDSFSEAILA